MKTIPYTDARRNLSKVFDRVCKTGKPVAIARRDGVAVAVVSLRDYSSMTEALHLLGAQANAGRLISSAGRKRTRPAI